MMLGEYDVETSQYFLLDYTTFVTSKLKQLEPYTFRHPTKLAGN